MKILIKAQTHYQIIIAIQLRRTLLVNHDVDIMVSDMISGSEKIIENLNNNRTFSKCYLVRNNSFYYERSKFLKALDILNISMLFTNRYLELLNVNSIMDCFYDEFWSYNWDIIDLIMTESLCKVNHDLRLIKFEEGLISHNSVPRDRGRLAIIHRLNPSTNLYDKIEKFYCMYPDIVYTFNKDIIKIPLITREDIELIELLNNVFEFDPSENHISERYIYFTSATDIDDARVGEIDLLSKISMKIDKDDLIIKVHPRESEEQYIDEGYKVMKVSGIPWEIVQLNETMENKTFLTVLSGSILNSTAMTMDRNAILFLWPLVKGKNNWTEKWCKDHLEPLIQNLHDRNLMKDISICTDINQII